MNSQPPNPGIAHILDALKLKRLEKLIEEKDAIIARQAQEITTLLEGIVLKGWFCRDTVCGVFNGNEKEIRLTCRGCGTAKPVIGDIPAAAETKKAL